MSNFICDTCKKEILPVDGILSWTREDHQLGNFKLTHKNSVGTSCEPADSNRYRELYTLTLATGFMEFISYLLERWEDGFTLTNPKSLRNVMRQLNLHIHEKLLVMVED